MQNAEFRIQARRPHPRAFCIQHSAFCILHFQVSPCLKASIAQLISSAHGRPGSPARPNGMLSRRSVDAIWRPLMPPTVTSRPSHATGERCAWHGRLAFRFATSWRRCITARFWWSPIASTGSSSGVSRSGSAGSSIRSTPAWCPRTTSSSSIRSAAPIRLRDITVSSIRQSVSGRRIRAKRARTISAPRISRFSDG